MRRGAALGVAAWIVAASIVEGVVGQDVGSAARRIQQGIEERLERHGAPPPAEERPSTHEVESIEPWELVGV
jgi:hypothetical protein